MVAMSSKFILVVSLLVLMLESVLAQRNNLQPKDFEPLTSLPWVEKKDALLEQVIDQIFREPKIDIRYPVLGEYLRQIPVKDLGRAFDIATTLEGTQTPDELVYFLLYIWAKRDPAAAWEKTRELFEVVGIEYGWLSFDSWENDAIEVQNRAAIERSRFWLKRETLMGFVTGVDDSDAPVAKRVGLMKAFANLWFERFQSWPASRVTFAGGYPDYLERTFQHGEYVIKAFDQGTSMLNLTHFSNSATGYRACCEVLWRRWLVSHPDEMNEVIRSIQSTVWPAEKTPYEKPEEHARISADLLMVWHRVNPSAFKAWVSEAFEEPPLLEAARTARCMILNEVPAAQRTKWISQMLDGDAGIENIARLAAWQPQLAMESAELVEGELELIHLVDSCAYGPLEGGAWNTSHPGFGYLKEHRLEHLTEPLRKKLMEGWFECTFMEQWGDLDIGEAARFGVNLLLTDFQDSRKDLLATLRGTDPPQADDGIWDRTFCALRVWAVVRPTEMKKWIATQEGEDLRSALTWLLEHPWGGPKSKP